MSVSFFCCGEKVFTWIHQYIDHWKKFNETSLPEKEDFQNHLNMEYITDEDYTYAKSL